VDLSGFEWRASCEHGNEVEFPENMADVLTVEATVSFSLMIVLHGMSELALFIVRWGIGTGWQFGRGMSLVAWKGLVKETGCEKICVRQMPSDFEHREDT
jgi:hypothetical protein